LKFSVKRAAKASYFFQYSSLLPHVLAGSRTSGGTSGQLVGHVEGEQLVLAVLHIFQLPSSASVQQVPRVADADPLADAERAAVSRCSLIHGQHVQPCLAIFCRKELGDTPTDGGP